MIFLRKAHDTLNDYRPQDFFISFISPDSSYAIPFNSMAMVLANNVLAMVLVAIGLVALFPIKKNRIFKCKISACNIQCICHLSPYSTCVCIPCYIPCTSFRNILYYKSKTNLQVHKKKQFKHCANSLQTKDKSLLLYIYKNYFIRKSFYN